MIGEDWSPGDQWSRMAAARALIRRRLIPRERHSVGGNIIWGVGMGLAIAALFSLLVTVLFLARPHRLMEEHAVSLGALILTYFIGGLGGGFIVGLMRPLSRWRAGSVATGIVSATFVYGAIGAAMYGPITRWREEHWIVAIVPGLVGGSVIGNWTWEEAVYPTLPPSEAGDPPTRNSRYTRWPR
jgi:MFS family permease